MPQWTVELMPKQNGRVAIVTGANSGVGYETALALAAKGAYVVLACRNLDKAQVAAHAIQQQVPSAKIDVMPLDLSSLASVHTFAREFMVHHNRLDMLINNAGVMAIPRQASADGYEMQFAVNHLGHFALTGLLLEMLLQTSDSRIVNVSSGASFYGSINFDDLQHEKSYSRYQAYGQSKLANLLFTFELQRQFDQIDTSTMALSAHPGYARTNLQQNAAQQSDAPVEGWFYRLIEPVLSQSAAMGALPTLYAATTPDIEKGGFYGPHFLHMRGYPTLIRGCAKAYDATAAKRLWQISEDLTHIKYDFLQPQAYINR